MHPTFFMGQDTRWSCQLAVLAVGLALSATTGHAQTQETYQAPLIFGEREADLTPAELETLSSDPTPFGVDLGTLVIVDARDNGTQVVAQTGRTGVDVLRAGELLQSPAFRARMAPFVGRPLSFQLISQIQASITTFLRENRQPLVSVTIPPQEVSGGGLQVNVVRFALGEVRAEGNDRTPDAALERAITVERGEVIDTDRLVEDLNWLNLNPFRRVGGVFAPGDRFGETDLLLQVEEGRPWSAYVGASNTGTEAAYKERLFAGANAVILPGVDVQLSYLLTLAPENVARGAIFDNGDEKGYLAHALGAFVPVTLGSGQRAKLTFQGTLSDSFSDSGTPFTSREKNRGASVELAFPNRTRDDGAWSTSGETYIRLQYDHLDTEQFFSGAAFDDRTTESTRAAVGLRRQYVGPLGPWSLRGSYDVALVAGQAAVERVGTDFFTAIQVSGDNVVSAPGDSELRLRYGGQYSPDELTTLDQFGVGGANSVRGYDTNAVSGNSALWVNVEWHAKPVSVSAGAMEFGLRPYLFADAGHVAGRDQAPSADLASLGAGLNVAAGDMFDVELEVARTLEPLVDGEDNDMRLHFNLTAQF